MAFRPSPAPQDRHTYVPPQMKQALAQHMQKSVPAHLKNYQQDGRSFIPTHVEKAIVDHMQKSVPAHMKEFVGAYVQQNVAFPATMPQAKPNVSATAPHMPRTTARPPVPQIPRGESGYARAYESQGQSTLELLKTSSPPAPPPATNTPDPYPQSPTPIDQTPPPALPAHPYEFIMNPDQPAAPKNPLLPGTSGTGARAVAIRIGLVAGGLVILLILFSVARGLLTGDGNKPLYMAVAQDQQELIHLTTNATAQQQALTTANSNFAATAKLSLTSARSDLITYMGRVGIKKVDPKILNLKISVQTDQQLADALVASTYNETFREIMKTKLERYKQDLQQAYSKTTGPNGKKLLSSQYDQADLLLKQLDTPAS